MKVVLKFVLAFLAVSVTYAEFFGEEQDVNLLELGPSSHFIGGNRVNPVDSLYTVGLNLYNASHVTKRCTAVRLDKNWFLTAAECLDKFFPMLEIVVPQENGNTGALGHFYAKWRELRFTVHPGYNDTTNENNIAIFQHVRTSNVPQTFVNLPSKNDALKTYDNERVILSGVSYFSGPNQQTGMAYIKALPTKVEKLSECKKHYSSEAVNKNIICTVNTGDNGLSRDDISAPLVIQTKPVPTLLGLGIPSRFQNDPFSPPMRFVRINQYVDWIKQTISSKKPFSS